MPIENLDETAKEILNAASRRFLHYGYGKTTMSEIAKDCNMSTGNLYRFFPSKLDIAEMFVRVLRREHVDNLRAVANDPSKSSTEKLKAFFLAKMRLAYDRFHDKPKAYELSSSLLTERPKVGMEWESAEAGVLCDIISMGNADGGFAIENPERNAKILLDAAYRFTSPAVFHEGEYDELADELNEVIDLMLDGFSWRRRLRAGEKPTH
ncbi:MAG: TetR/AcrR family transcriptional regulator [Marinicaulis sp.]|nr:TetR/AcrR family transcriptional regulator [Marinicaulis sp.]NNE40543.1 TetR/AcrR family transcriptional regulator [Marinicaulis sp.]NNL88971.1 TetR/AcrR family transcriptional regulator [Marinicaulis sp.]